MPDHSMPRFPASSRYGRAKKLIQEWLQVAVSRTSGPYSGTDIVDRCLRSRDRDLVAALDLIGNAAKRDWLLAALRETGRRYGRRSFQQERLLTIFRGRGLRANYLVDAERNLRVRTEELTITQAAASIVIQSQQIRADAAAMRALSDTMDDYREQWVGPRTLGEVLDVLVFD
jgi:hypothetical protein